MNNITIKNQNNLSTEYDISNLTAEINHYMDDHYQDHLKILGLSPTSKLTFSISDKIEKVQFTWSNSTTCHIELPLPLTYRILITPILYQWANGVSLVPVLHAFCKHKVLEKLTLSSIFLTDIAPKKNWGIVWGAFHLLGLQGWIKIEGHDENSQFSLTDLGIEVSKIIKQYAETVTRICNAIPLLSDYHQHIYQQTVTQNITDELQYLVELCLNNWKIASNTNDFIQLRAEKQVINFLDGLLIAPILVGLGMPLYRRTDNGRIIIEKTSFLSKFQETDCQLYTDTIKDYSPSLLKIAIQLLTAKGLFNQYDNKINLTAKGKASLPIASPYSALAVSYLKSYQHIEELLFTNQDPLGIEQDHHVNRIMNIYGSSGAGSGPNAKEISENILNYLFNELPLSEQPKGIADMGCGDGSSLKRLAEFIIQHTKRGQQLKNYPLYVIGADLYEKPLKLTQENLSDLNQINGVHVIVIQADISNPDLYNKKLQDLQIKLPNEEILSLNDLLHTFMFLIHNRRLQLTSTDEATAIIEKQLTQIDKNYLQAILINYFDLKQIDITTDNIKSLFKTSYTAVNDFAQGFLVAADLIQFLLRWQLHTNKHGFIALDAHTPWNCYMLEPVPIDINKLMRADKLPHPLNWGMHFISRQYLMPFCEYILALTLAGYKPMNNAIYGRIHPDIPNIDLLNDYRFFSIGCFRTE